MEFRPGTSATVVPIRIRAIRIQRLAELVHALTGCGVRGALHAVHRSTPPGVWGPDEPLAIVARAIVSVRHGIDLRDDPSD
jgi:hypothetical protein